MISDGTVIDARARRFSISITFSSTLLAAVLATASMLFAAPVFAQGVLGNCAAEYTTGQGGLNCTAADDGGDIAALNPPSFCIIGDGLTFDVQTTFLNSAQAERYDMRYWVAIDGGDPRDTAADGGPANCSLTALPFTIDPAITDEETIAGDTCGDVAGGVLFPLTTIDTVTLDCIPDADGAVHFNTAITWQTKTGLDCAIDGLRGDPHDLGPDPDISKSQAACVETTLATEFLGRVTVIKSAPDNTDFTFDWSTDAPPVINAGMNPADPFTLNNSQVAGEEIFALVKDGTPATVTITEQDLAGYQLSGISCPGGSVNVQGNTVTVTLSYDEANPGLADVECTFTNVVVQTNPAMSVSKTSTTGAVTAPGDVVYQYLVSNTGDVALTNISLSDDNDNDDISCPGGHPIPTLAVGANITCSATHTVTQAEIDANGSPVSDSGLLSNTVTASSTETGDETASLDIPITQTPLLSIDKIGTFNDENMDGLGQVGESISYTFDVSNDGNVTLTSILVTDPLVTISCAPEADPIADLDPGETVRCTATYVVTQADIDAGQRDNLATADSDQTGPATDPETVPLGQDPLMTVDKTSPTTEITAAGDVSYNYVVTNTGNVTLTGIGLVDDNTDGLVTCDAITLAPGDSMNCSAQHTLTQGEFDANGSPVADSGFLVNNVDATSNEAPLAEDSLSIPITQSTSVQIVKSGTWNDDGPTPGIAEAGETITYTFTVTNTGTTTQTNIAVTDPLITDPPNSGTISCTGENNPIVDLDPAEVANCSATYTITQADVDAGSRDNTGTATSDQSSDSDDETVNLPNVLGLALVKTGTFQDTNMDGFAQAGETIDYQFVVTNNSSITVSNVSVTDPLVPGIDCTPEANPIADMAPGEQVSCTGTYVLTQDDVDAGQVDNTATADSDDTEPVTDDETVPLTTRADLALAKTGTFNDENRDGFAQDGETISYDFLVTNTGDVTQTIIAVTDPLVSPITCPSGNPIPSLAPGASETCTGSYTINQADVDAGSRDNTGTVVSDQTPPVTDDETVPLPQGSDLTVVKSSQTTSIGAPMTVSYSYLVSNAGDTTLTGISLTDDNIDATVTCLDVTLPPGGSFICSAAHTVTQAEIDANGSPVADSGELFNNVTASSDQAPDATADLSIPFAIDPAITMVKSSTTTQVSDAGPVDYSYFVTNTGNVTLTGIRIDDDNDEDDASCPVSTLAPAESTTCTATHNVTQAELTDNGSPVAGSGTLDNNATAFGSSPQNTDDVTATSSLSIPFAALVGRFTVVKIFSDGNPAEVDVEITCNTGLPLHNEFTISQGKPVTFVVTEFTPGEMNCEITEVVPDDYTPDYYNGDVNSLDSCLYEDVGAGAAHACIIYNELEEVTVTVNKEWTGVTEEDAISLFASADYSCFFVRSSPDGDLETIEGRLDWDGEFDSDLIEGLYPDYAGSSYCTVSELQLNSAAEGDDSDCAHVPVTLGQDNSCTIYNTVFFEGIPTLNRYGMLLMALLMLGIGAVGFRRFS